MGSGSELIGETTNAMNNGFALTQKDLVYQVKCYMRWCMLLTSSVQMWCSAYIKGMYD